MEEVAGSVICIKMVHNTLVYSVLCVLLTYMKIYRIAKSEDRLERWQVRTADDGYTAGGWHKVFDTGFFVRIPVGLQNKALAEALSLAADEKEGLSKKSKVTGWEMIGRHMIIKCKLPNGKLGVMECLKS